MKNRTGHKFPTRIEYTWGRFKAKGPVSNVQSDLIFLRLKNIYTNIRSQKIGWSDDLTEV